MRTIALMCVFVLLLAATGCTRETRGSSGETQSTEAKLTESNQQRLISRTPPPQLDKSLERENLVRRLNFLNDEQKIFYVYLVSYGKVMAYYTAKGKVSSVNSKLTTGEQVLDSSYLLYNGGMGTNRLGAVVVESPALDGSYGTNGDAVFFFTTEDIYVEWNGEYMVSSEPLDLATPPILVRTVGEPQHIPKIE